MTLGKRHISSAISCLNKIDHLNSELHSVVGDMLMDY